MNSTKKIAKIIGVLFLIVSATSIIGSNNVENIMYAPDYLSIAYPNRIQWKIGMLIHLISAIGTIGIVVLMFSILKRQNINLAIGYLVFRTIEAIMIIITEIHSFYIVLLSKEFIESGTSNVIGILLQEGRSSIYELVILFFCVGSFMFYYSMYKSKIIPQFISLWGGVAIIVCFFKTLLNIFEIDVPFGFVFYIPIALNEIVLSIWLIAKGFKLPSKR
jgi:hypothetical protein